MADKVYGEVRSRDGGRCRVCGSTNLVQVHHIQFRSKGGGNEPENLIALCGDCHDGAHNKVRNYLPPWELELLVRLNLGHLRAWRRSMRHGVANRLCLSCERRTETWECLIWDHPVSWDYDCEAWTERDKGGLPDCGGDRFRQPAAVTVYNCTKCRLA
jgi:hypothetical protein